MNQLKLFCHQVIVSNKIDTENNSLIDIALLNKLIKINTYINELNFDYLLNFNLISSTQAKFLEKHKIISYPYTINNINWDYICKKYKLSIDVITKYINYVNWENICQYQTLSESFIEEYIDLVHWKNISRYQILTEDFIIKYKQRIDLISLSESGKLLNNSGNSLRDKLKNQAVKSILLKLRTIR